MAESAVKPRNPFAYARPTAGTRCDKCMAVDREWEGIADPPPTAPTARGGFHLVGYRHKCGNEIRFEKPRLA